MLKLKIYSYATTSGYPSTAYYHGFIGTRHRFHWYKCRLYIC